MLADYIASKKIGTVLLITVLLITGIAGWVASSIKFQYDIESFFSKSDPELNYYHDFRKTFENDNDFVLVGLPCPDGIFQKSFLERLGRLTDSLANLAHIQYVQSPTNLKNVVISPLGSPFEIPLIHIEEPERYPADAQKIYEDPRWVNAFFSADTQAVSLFIKKEEFTGKAVNDSLLKNIEGALTTAGFDTYYLAGRIRTQNYYVGQMQSETALFAVLALVLLVVFLVLSFRNVWALILPLFVIIASVVWTFAIIHLTGQSLDLMMTMLPTLLFVIGISSSVHFISRFREERGEGKEKKAAILLTVKEIGLATFLTAFTTAVGFASLAFIEIPPIQRFGLYTAVGVMITFVVTLMVIPPALHFLPVGVTYPQRKTGGFLNRILQDVFVWVIANQRKIGIASLLIALIAVFGIGKIQVNNYFLDDLNNKSSLKTELHFFEENFSGIRPFEMGMDLTDSTQTLFDIEVLREIETVETYLRDTYGTGFLTSPVTVIKSANQALNGGGASTYKIPETKAGLQKVVKNLKSRKVLEKVKTVLKPDGSRGRIQGKINDSGSQILLEKNEALATFLKSHTGLVKFHLTGAAELMDRTNSNIATSLLSGLGLALFIVALVAGLLLRSVKTALLSLIPNVIPLLIIAGVMGYFGIDLKVATALIFSIAFGIAVDDTIHLLSKLRIELSKGNPLPVALKRAFLSTGKAIVLTSFVLSAGFITFIFSDFKGTFTIGLLISITLMLAVLADLLVLPVLLLGLQSRKKRKN